MSLVRIKLPRMGCFRGRPHHPQSVKRQGWIQKSATIASALSRRKDRTWPKRNTEERPLQIPRETFSILEQIQLGVDKWYSNFHRSKGQGVRFDRWIIHWVAVCGESRKHGSEWEGWCSNAHLDPTDTAGVCWQRWSCDNFVTNNTFKQWVHRGFPAQA